MIWTLSLVGKATLVHSIDRRKIMRVIDEVAREEGFIQRGLLQVNVSGEAAKFGMKPEEVAEAINAANDNPGADTISFAGLGATGGDVTIQLNSFLNPLLDNGTTIDGTTVLGYVNEPVVNIVKASGVIESGISIQGRLLYRRPARVTQFQ